MHGKATRFSLALPAAAVFSVAPAAPFFDDQASTPEQQPIEHIMVTATRLRNARVELSPRVGTTVYTVTSRMIDALGQGESTPFNDVLQHLPGVSQDAKGSGSLHVRDEHGNVQYRINGVQLPEGISGFGQAIDTRLVDRVDFMTGALPAQFGLRTAGIVDIQTKEGGESGGEVGLVLGSHDQVQPNAEVFGAIGRFNYYLSGNVERNNQGIENPQPTHTAIHDSTRQAKSFGNLSWLPDDDTRFGLMFGTYVGHFQIPNNPNQAPAFALAGSNLPSSALNERQREENRYVVLSYQRKLGDLDLLASYYHQSSQLHYLPDVAGDLLYTGVASDTLRTNSANGVQLDASYRLAPAHTLRGGLAYTRQGTSSINSVAVFPADASGAQTSDEPFTIIDDSGKKGTLSSLYLQDEWHANKELTVNYGLRFDRVSAFVQEQQWSPRLNLAYQLAPGTALHAGYSRYFTPPAQELAAQRSIALYANTTNAPEVPFSDPAKAERSNYYDVGISHQVTKELTVTADAYYRKVSDMLDEGQFGRALIETPFNYARGRALGLELAAIYSGKRWSGYLNAAVQKAQGTNINSGQALFSADELAYIANHYIYADHDQRWTLSGGASYRFGDSQLSGDFLFGSGLRRTPDGAPPNSGALPAYATVNTTYTHTWPHTRWGRVEARVAINNLFDRVYLLRDGSGVGVGAPQYGARRGLSFGLSTSF